MNPRRLKNDLHPAFTVQAEKSDPSLEGEAVTEIC